MGRMPGNSFSSWGVRLLVVLPVLGAGFGVYQLARQWQHSPGTGDAAKVLKPSALRAKAGEKIDYGTPYEDEFVSEEDSDAPQAGRRIASHLEEDAAAKDGHGKKGQGAAHAPARGLRLPASTGSSSGSCASVEFPGDNPAAIKVTKEDWTAVMAQFHGIKRDMLGWLKANHGGLPDATVKAMESQIRELKVQRPPQVEQPDLAWRGIGVWSLDHTGAPVLRLGGGFVKMLLKQPARGRFELARLVAQAWAPCELARVKAENPWNPLLQCMGAPEGAIAAECTPGSYSESGWAMPTAVAAVIAPPGCTIPAFENPQLAACLSGFTFSKVTTQAAAPVAAPAPAAAAAAPATPAANTSATSAATTAATPAKEQERTPAAAPAAGTQGGAAPAAHGHQEGAHQ